tara:strand:- start:5535 stop:5741 length:207 start_codon:yes stop_codon:yes gene_type:complete
MTLNDWVKTQELKSLNKIAAKLQVDDTTNPARLVQRWLQGKSIPSPKNMTKIWKNTDGQVTPNDFYTN